MSVATPEGVAAAEASGYSIGRVVGWVFISPAEGRVPLKLYYNPATGDDLSTATTAGEQTARLNGYVFVRDEGYVISADVGDPPPGTMPLKLFYSPGVTDHCTMASVQGEQDALAAGYSVVRVEGYVPKPPVPRH